MMPGLVFALRGVAVGMGLSFAAVRFLRHLLWGVPPVDPLTFAATAALLLVVDPHRDAAAAKSTLSVDVAWFEVLMARYLPAVQVKHPYPLERSYAKQPR